MAGGKNWHCAPNMPNGVTTQNFEQKIWKWEKIRGGG